MAWFELELTGDDVLNKYHKKKMENCVFRGWKTQEKKTPSFDCVIAQEFVKFLGT